MSEEWRPVAGHEGVYEVSSAGRVRSLPRIDARGHLRKGKYLRPLYGDRYPICALYVHGIRKPIKIHRLVALAFVPNPDGKPEVNHIDGNTCNASAENLEWVTRRENCLHAVSIGRWPRRSA